MWNASCCHVFKTTMCEALCRGISIFYCKCSGVRTGLTRNLQCSWPKEHERNVYYWHRIKFHWCCRLLKRMKNGNFCRQFWLLPQGEFYVKILISYLWLIITERTLFLWRYKSKFSLHRSYAQQSRSWLWFFWVFVTRIKTRAHVYFILRM